VVVCQVVVARRRGETGGYDAKLMIEGGAIYGGWGLTEETATLDAYASWRVAVGRAQERGRHTLQLVAKNEGA
jgi:hypothetical protein